MVDFQSRDTRRGHGSDDDDSDDESTTEDATADTAEEEQPVTTDGTETGDEHGEAGAPEAGTDVDRTEQSDAGGSDVERPDTVSYAVVTVAAGRTLEEDTTGGEVADAVDAAGEAVATRELLAPSYDGVQTAVGALVGRSDVDAVVTLGGTGVEPSDVTVDAVGGMLDKRLPGFGELFRALVHDDEGSAVVRTRATAGIVDGVPVFCLPGDPATARRGVEEIVLAEAGTLAAQASEADGPE